jgi:hypothetical protein
MRILSPSIHPSCRSPWARPEIVLKGFRLVHPTVRVALQGRGAGRKNPRSQTARRARQALTQRVYNLAFGNNINGLGRCRGFPPKPVLTGSPRWRPSCGRTALDRRGCRRPFPGAFQYNPLICRSYCLRSARPEPQSFHGSGPSSTFAASRFAVDGAYLLCGVSRSFVLRLPMRSDW